MKKEEAQIFAEYLSATASIYGRELTKEVIKIYLYALKDYSFDAIKKAIERCILTKESFPVPATIIKELNNKGDLLIGSELAWGYVLNVIDVCGIYESFTFRDKIIRKTLSLMDYEMLCICGRSEIHWKKKEFIESYKSFLKINNYDAPNYFSGVLELNNGDLWTDIVGQTKVYVAEDGKFVNIDKLNEFIEGYKPALKLIKKNDVKTIEKGVLNGK
jgi:hypothetical protein